VKQFVVEFAIVGQAIADVAIVLREVGIGEEAPAGIEVREDSNAYQMAEVETLHLLVQRPVANRQRLLDRIGLGGLLEVHL